MEVMYDSADMETGGVVYIRLQLQALMAVRSCCCCWLCALSVTVIGSRKFRENAILKVYN